MLSGVLGGFTMPELSTNENTTASQSENKIRLILHVGMHKTGSTSIQNFLCENSGYLRTQGIYALDSGNGKPLKLRFALERGEREEATSLIQDLLRQVEESNCHTLVLSDEDFTRSIKRTDHCLELLNSYFDVEVLVYIRRQDKMLESIYGFSIQWYPTRRTLGSEEILTQLGKKDFGLFLDKWEGIVGFDAVHVKIFDELIRTKESLLLDFIGFLALPESHPWIFPTKEQSNITLNKYIINFLQRTNHIPLEQPAFEALISFLSTESTIQKGPKASFFEEETRLEIFATYAESNGYVAKKYFNRDVLFSDTSLPKVEPELSEERFLAVMEEVKLKNLL